ncbi:MAG: flippase-like domain-containing protein [Planctomycetes bacterium]|nr:flippase-like domain-containing protein [Planctomycetota bacterium]
MLSDGSPAVTRSRMRWTKGIVRLAIFLIVVVFVGLAIQRAVQELRLAPAELSWQKVRWPLILLGFACNIIALFPACIGWVQTLRDFQQPIAWRPAIYAYFLGHLGKYVPGKAMAILLRITELHRYGVLVRPAIVSVFIETLTSLATGAILGAVFLQAMNPPPWLRWSALAGIPIALLALLPHPFRAIVSKISQSRVGRMPEVVARSITSWMMLRTCLWSVLGWMLQGTATWILLMGISPKPEIVTVQGWMVCVTSMSLGALAGFLSMLPGGAGVREIVSMWLMSSLVPQPIALASAVVARLVSIIAELIVISTTRIINEFFRGSAPTSS